MKTVVRSFVLAVMALTLFAASPVWASPKQGKIYQEAFAAADKPKCIACHVGEKPKKDDHALNAYGQKVADAAAEDPTVEDYKKVGPLAS